jgi:hypothetical protein
MVVIGVTYLKIYHPIQLYAWHYKHWRAEGVIEKIMFTLHGRVREQVKKKSVDNSSDN